MFIPDYNHDQKTDSRRGQSMVEFALVLPLLLFMTLAIMDMGRALLAYTNASFQVRSALRQGVILGYSGGTPSYLDCAKIHNVAKSVLFGSNVTSTVQYIRASDGATVACTPGTNAAALDAAISNGDMLNVQISATVQMMTPFLPSTLPISMEGRRTLVKSIDLNPDIDPLISDNLPPTVAITAPADGATVSGTINVTVDATDDEQVLQVVFVLDDLRVLTDVDPDGGWTLTLDTTLYTNGSHKISAIATDTDATTAVTEITITFDNSGAAVVDNPPTVYFASPGNGDTVAGTVTLYAVPSDDNGVGQSTFFIDDVWRGTNVLSILDWDTTGSSDGAHEVRVSVTDTIGQTTEAIITVNVNNGSTDPPPAISTVLISANPASGFVILSTTVTDFDDTGTEVPVTGIAFYADGQFIGNAIDTNDPIADPPDGNWTLPWNTQDLTYGVANGTYTITAIATDSAAQTGSRSIIVDISN